MNYIFTLPEVTDYKLAFLSNHLCQDPLESFFGCQRQRGGTNENPSIAEFYNNTQAIRVIDSFCRAPVRGNCRGARSLDSTKNLSVSARLTKRRKLTYK